MDPASDDIIRAATDVLEPPKGQGVTEPEGVLYLSEEQRHAVEKHPLLIWTGLTPGDVVSLRVPGIRDLVGTVETSTSDGLIIWIRDDLNERRLFHFHDCQSVRLLR